MNGGGDMSLLVKFETDAIRRGFIVASQVGLFLN